MSCCSLIICASGSKWFDIEDGTNLECPKPTVHFTMIFNTFVLMTLFNEVNARKIHGQRNILDGLHKNYLFLGIWFGTLIGQVSNDTWFLSQLQTIVI